MVVFEDQQETNKRDTDDGDRRGKRRAVLLEGDTDVWTIAHCDQETEDKATAGEEFVAIHPKTKEQLTHSNMVEFVQMRLHLNGWTEQQFLAWLKQIGAKTDQNVMDVLFPTEV